MDNGKRYSLEDSFNIFFTECREVLDEMEARLLDLEKDLTNEENINAVFRAAHTIKGSSGMFGYEYIENFTHVIENILDEIRIGKLYFNSDLIAIFLECHDYLLKLLDYFNNNREAVTVNEAFQEEGRDIKKRLNTYSTVSQTDTVTSTTGNGLSTLKNENWHISLRFEEEIFRCGLDPAPCISYLNEIGEIVNIKPVYDNIPGFHDLDPESCYLGFEIDFKGNVNKNKIEEAFEFVQDDCKIRIIPPDSSIREFIKLINELPEETKIIGNILTEIGSITEKDLNEALRKQTELNEKNEDKKQIGDILVEENLVHEQVLKAALEKQKRSRSSEKKARKTMRVDSEKLDILINTLGELVIAQAQINQLVSETENIEILETTSNISRLIEDIRDQSMSLRMMPIGNSFKRFERVVRDLSKEQGKEIEFVTKGSDTELDKTLIEKIIDPVMHLVRNAVDHGIDRPEERMSMGKPARGSISINAYQATGSFVIEIKDDGVGLNREKIILKAIQKEMISPEEGEKLPDNIVFQYIFVPGFSTADRVTEISGRGVGMDVVKKNIESLRGSVVIQSKEGEGTSISIHLPLTLAIIDGFVVRVGGSNYIIPLEMINRCVEVPVKDLDYKQSGNFLKIQGEIVPFINLNDFFKQEEEQSEVKDVVVVIYAGKKAGFIVDELIGEFQIVVKPLGYLFNNVHWISGATILNDGSAAVILDVPRLAAHARTAKAS